MDVWLRAIVIILASVLGSGGFWAFLQKQDRKKNATTRLMMGLAYTQITGLGIMYINRGSITRDEFEDFQRYFFTPYKDLGGNGVAERIMHDVERLPFRKHEAHTEIYGNNEERFIENVPVRSQRSQ